ncbi:MAG: tRNA (pseudouridine(54)-N(1))-methyltransferase TrmY [Candidatus Handelsmanbacteria bacterium]|nr:tRNA (pseudouridine(54)-N(1))-methyltransferase TrmY [Candidatus Handelsmanbacteria bacterium]
MNQAGGRVFILRARKAPTSPAFSLDDLARAGHLEIAAHCVANALFISGQIRPAIALHLVLEGAPDPPRTLRLESDTLGSLGGFDERSICQLVQRALGAGRHLKLGEELRVNGGVYVAKRSFEQLVREQSAALPLYHLQPRGEDIRATRFSLPAAFVFSDHLSMPKKADKYLVRLGARPLSVGPRRLFASQCIALVHNELDRQRL